MELFVDSRFEAAIPSYSKRSGFSASVSKNTTLILQTVQPLQQQLIELAWWCWALWTLCGSYVSKLLAVTIQFHAESIPTCRTVRGTPLGESSENLATQSPWCYLLQAMPVLGTWRRFRNELVWLKYWAWKHSDAHTHVGKMAHNRLQTTDTYQIR
jgi:hypothetical protein